MTAIVLPVTLGACAVVGVIDRKYALEWVSLGIGFFVFTWALLLLDQSGVFG